MYDDGVKHAPSIKIYNNRKIETKSVVDIFVNNCNKEKLNILKSYNTKIYKFVMELIDTDKDLLNKLWNLHHEDLEYEMIMNQIIDSLYTLNEVSSGRVKIRKVVKK